MILYTNCGTKSAFDLCASQEVDSSLASYCGYFWWKKCGVTISKKAQNKCVLCLFG